MMAKPPIPYEKFVDERKPEWFFYKKKSSLIDYDTEQLLE